MIFQDAVGLAVFGTSVTVAVTWVAGAMLQNLPRFGLMSKGERFLLVTLAVLAHAGLTVTALAANTWLDEAWSAPDLLVANIGIAFTYIAVIGGGRRLDANLMDYKLSWRDARDTLVFLSGPGLMLLTA